ncbi:MAG: sulfurtransferase [Stappiaceae bacterium]
MPANTLLQDVIDTHSPLVSADQLEELLSEPTLKVFDVRGTWSTSPASASPHEYDAGHIPGAVFLDWTKHFVEQDVALGLAAVAEKNGAEQAFGELGINEGDLVVLYDDYHHMLAGRIWWAMRHWGFANVRVLNGGWRYWSARNKPVSQDSPEIAPGTFQPQQKEGLLISLEQLISTKDQHCVIDARGAQSYAGKAEDPRTGHIPGSLNLPFAAVLDPETGLFLDPGSIAGVFDKATPQWREKPVITTCGSGYAATITLLALSELEQTAGMFDGSFAIWKQDPDRPVSQAITE